MHFSQYPFDVQECTFRLGSFASTADEITYVPEFTYDRETQRHLPFRVNIPYTAFQIIHRILRPEPILPNFFSS